MLPSLCVLSINRHASFYHYQTRTKKGEKTDEKRPSKRKKVHNSTRCLSVFTLSRTVSTTLTRIENARTLFTFQSDAENFKIECKRTFNKIPCYNQRNNSQIAQNKKTRLRRTGTHFFYYKMLHLLDSISNVLPIYNYMYHAASKNGDSCTTMEV